MRLLYSGLNGSGCDLDSRIHGCPVEEHSLGRTIALDLKKKKNETIRIQRGEGLVHRGNRWAPNCITWNCKRTGFEYMLCRG